MIKNIVNKSWLLGICLALPLSVQATLIDFDALPDGNYATVGDTSFSLVGEGVTGDPIKSSLLGPGYLFNSSQPFLLPTNSILRVDFNGLVDNLMFDFNGFGPEASLMTWRIFDENLTELATGNDLTASLASFDLSAFSGISRIEFFNGGGNVNRFFGLQQISFDSQVASVPLPHAIWLLVSALLSFALVRKHRSQI
ncbi:hypothetical protein [Thalassotalea montiporae]